MSKCWLTIGSSTWTQRVSAAELGGVGWQVDEADGVGILNGEKPANPQELMDTALVTRDNVDKYPGWATE